MSATLEFTLLAGFVECGSATEDLAKNFRGSSSSTLVNNKSSSNRKQLYGISGISKVASTKL